MGHICYRLMAAMIILMATLLRFKQLVLPPLHHDEGINGFFMMKLAQEGIFRYDPRNFHGPSFFYLDLPLLKVLGLETFNLRLLPAMFGVALVLVVLCARIVSRSSALWGAAMIAVSPGMVYFSRYFIHEMLVVFFTMGIVAAVGWRGKPITCLRIVIAAMSAGFLFATKETAAPTVVVLFIAAGMTSVLLGIWPFAPRHYGAAEELSKDRLRMTLSAFRVLSVSGAVFAIINVVLYSSFFQNWAGLGDAARSLTFWSATGTKDHVHPLWQYVLWLAKEESVLLVLGCSGVGLAFIRRNSTPALFCALWSLGMLSMYSLIPYKTPWLSLNILLPFALMAGYALEELSGGKRGRLGVGVACVAVAFSLFRCVNLNFIQYDDNEVSYVYAHTVRDINRLVRDVDRLFGDRPDFSIAVVAKEYWPLPWLWRDRTGVIYYGQMVDLDDMPVVLAQDNQEREMARRGRGMKRMGTYTLRPGVNLVLWARNLPTMAKGIPETSPPKSAVAARK